jgi:flagellin-like protein
MEIILLVITLLVSGKMSNRYLIKKNKAKKGISPVIATVILVAVAVVIAAALAGFSSSLFGTYSSAGAAVTVSSLTVDENGAGDVSLVNSGNVADRLLSMQVVGRETATLDPVTLDIPADGATQTADFIGLADTADALVADTFEEGQTITVRMNLESGIQLTQSVIVNPAA